MWSGFVDNDTGQIYQRAFDTALVKIKSRDPSEIVLCAKAHFNPVKSFFILDSLGQQLKITYPEGDVTFVQNGQKPLWSLRLLALNYLGRADNMGLSNRLISFRETENGSVFYPAFYRESIAPLAKISQEPLTLIEKASCRLGGRLEKAGDIIINLDFYPRFPVTVKLWPPDDEIEGAANILFDANANHYLHTEDIAAVGDIVSEFLRRILNDLHNEAVPKCDVNTTKGGKTHE